MTPKNSDYNYRYRCKSCNENIVVKYLHCNNCGMVKGNFESTDPAMNYCVVCEKCNQELSYENLPEDCNLCGSFHNEWWNTKNKKWFQPDLSILDELGKDSIWIFGDFDCNYVGKEINTGIAHLESDTRNYQLTLSQGKLINISRVIGPPDNITDIEWRPIRQDNVSAEVLDVASGKFITLKLYDFRLHSYENIGFKKVQTGNKINGRVSGKAYGYITPSNNPDPKKSVIIPIKDNPPQSDKVKAPKNLTTTNKIVPKESEVIKELEIVKTSNCLNCSLWLIVLLSVFLWIGCGWKLALTCLITMTYTCWLDRWLEKNGHKIQSWIKRFFYGLGLLLLSIIGIFIFTLLLAIKGCQSTNLWPLLLPLIALFLSARLYNCFFKLVMEILWFITLLVLCGMNSRDCITSNTAIDSSAPMINRIESIDAPMSNSLDHLKMPIANSIENIKQNADQFFTGEESSNAVSQASNGSVNGRQVSIDEALINTQFISDCTSSVYFPNTALFSFNKDEIEPSAKKELTKLKELLKKFPGRHVIITGHTDISGDNTPEGRLHNIELSERRATSVINWLVTNGGLDPNLLEARGAGSKFPLTLQIGQLGINRRVEVKLRCIDHAQ